MADHTFTETIQILRDRGYRITPQRELIVAAVWAADDHITAEEILGIVQQKVQAVNIATVYRTLETLVDEGLVCQNDLNSGSVVYSPRQHGPHIHLVCRRCNHVIEADFGVVEPLRVALAQQYGFEAELHHLSLLGTCKHCMEDQA